MDIVWKYELFIFNQLAIFLVGFEQLRIEWPGNNIRWSLEGGRNYEACWTGVGGEKTTRRQDFTMAQREKYALVLWLEDPRSADVVLKSEIVPEEKFPILLPKQERKAVWNGKPYPALIVATGEYEQWNNLQVY